MHRNRTLAVVVVSLLFLFSSCSTLTTTSTQSITINRTTPTTQILVSTVYVTITQSTTVTNIPSSTIPIGTPVSSTAQQYPISLVSFDRITQPTYNGQINPAGDWMSLTIKNVSQQQINTLTISINHGVLYLSDYNGGAALPSGQPYTIKRLLGGVFYGFIQGQIYPMLFAGTFGDGTAFNYTLDIVAY